MTTDDIILLAATIAAANSIASDDMPGNPQECVTQFFLYLDTFVPGMKDRVDYYRREYGMWSQEIGLKDKTDAFGNLISGIQAAKKIKDVIK